MWRYYYTIIRKIFRIPEAIKTMEDMIELSKNRPDEYNEEIKYRYVQYIADVMQKTGKVKTYNREWTKRTGYPLIIIKNASHNSNADNPEEVNDAIVDFIKNLQSNI